jgi:cell wall assembly regulator SMI1
MAVGYVRREPPASPELVARLEEQVGRALPDDYRSYLLEQDGGRLADNNQALINIFGLGQVPDWTSMWAKLETFHGRIPAWLLPVAQDAYGNLFAISLRPSDFGSVWFWDHEEEADEGEPPSEENISFKAGNWVGFLEGLEGS